MLLTRKTIQRLCFACALLAFAAPKTAAFTLEELKADANLTPESFIKRFADFKFRLGEKVQSPEVFLAKQQGDCDDFATLAADVLSENGYTPKLIVVFMAQEIHVVCYVAEAEGYLDFNNRKLRNPVIPADGSIRDVAEKVAYSFGSTWHCASEFTFNNGVRKFLFTDFRPANPPVEKAPGTEESEQKIASASSASEQGGQ